MAINEMNDSLSKRTILVVDDIEMNRSIIKKIFQDIYSVLTAENGAKGMEILRKHDIDLVLLDIVMPIMDGFEVIKAMKADSHFSTIPIIVITGEIERVEKKAFDLGVDDFLTQPYDPSIMRSRVENLIERYELRKMRDALHEQRRYRDLFDIIGIAYWEWTRSGGYYHSEKYNEFAISEMSDEMMWDADAPFQYIHPEDVTLMRQFMQKHDDDDEIKKSAIVRCLMRDGSYRWTEMFSMAETSADGQLIRLVSIMKDVDKEWLEQKEKLEVALDVAQKANQAKTDFLSRVSHDMRTPLNGILGLTTILKDSITDKDALSDLNELEMSGKYLLDLINDTLDMGRIESGNLELHPIVYDGRSLFNNAIRLAKMSMKGRDLKLIIHADKIPFTQLYVDVSRFDQIIMNVIGNAVKFTPDGGTITITLSNISVKNGVITDELVISDTGVGISEEFLPHIFEAFSQADTSKKNNSQGTGLGMAITKQLLQCMGGDITVDSALGKGTVFTLRFKLQIATDEQINEWKKTRNVSVGSVNLEGKRILMCEDHPLNTKIATKLLEAKGMRVEHAENGQEGIDMFRRSVPGYYDAILMDIRMPVKDGIEAAKEIRAMSNVDAKRIPIIAMTANAFADDIAQTQEVGMNAHLSKPIETEILYSTLAKLIGVSQETHKQTVLVVDDIEVNRAVIRSSLEKDYEILEAENGRQAIDMMYSVHAIDAVITDIQMPEMNGIELIRQIRSEKLFRHVVIIANTQFGDPKQEEELLALGANDFVYKPTTPKIVEIRVRNVLKRV